MKKKQKLREDEKIMMDVAETLSGLGFFKVKYVPKAENKSKRR